MTRYNALEERRWVPVRNDSGEAIPPFSAAKITGRSSSGSGTGEFTFFTIDKPDADLEADPTGGLLIVTGEVSIPIGSYGRGTQDWPAQVRQDGTTETAGTEIGPVDGEWEMATTGRGFTRIGGGPTIATGIKAVFVTLKAQAPQKLLVRFTIDSALTTGDASVAATITNQYGPGPDGTETAITVHNLLTSVAATYVFSGASGAAGLAMWDSGTDYRIIQMECP